MKPLQQLLSCALVVMLSSMGWARINETPEECADRYGPPTKTVDAPENLNAPGAIVSFFSKGGFRIVATFSDGKAGIIFFEKEERDSLGNPIEMSETECDALLESNSAGKKWEPASPIDAGWNFSDKAWLIEDKSVLAVHDTTNHRLLFTSSAFAELQNKIKASKERNNLDGF